MQWILTDSWPELILVGLSLLILAVYHFRLARLTRTKPEATSLGKANLLRAEWVRVVMLENHDILGIQTLRNWVMASTFLASTSILINIAILNVTFQMNEASAISHSLNFLGSDSNFLWMIKLLLLTILFFFAFFNFTLSVRYYNHAGFMIDIPVNDTPDDACRAAADIINRGAFHYFLGMRGYYLAIPMTLWLFGPIWMLAGTIMMVFIVHYLDRTI